MLQIGYLFQKNWGGEDEILFVNYTYQEGKSHFKSFTHGNKVYLSVSIKLCGYTNKAIKNV